MKILIKLTILSFLILNDQIVIASSIEVHDTITENTVWDADTVKVCGYITIEDSVTLIIAPGVYVEFQGEYGIRVFGKISAIGTVTDTITFTVRDTIGYSQNNHTGWRGISFHNRYNQVAFDTSKLIYCKLTYAVGQDYGGAIECSSNGKLILSNCLLMYNYAHSGGAICVEGNALLKNNKILFNKAKSGAGVKIGLTESVILFNNLICNNNAESSGGGIYLYQTAYLINNTICNNNAQKGGGVYYYGGLPVFINNILWYNNSETDKNQFDFYGDREKPEFYNNNIEGGLPEYSDDFPISLICKDNIDVNPGFTNANNYRLSDSSHCINSGKSNIPGLDLAYSDLADNPRIYKGIVDEIDMGAYEFQGNPVNRKPLVIKTGNQHTFRNSVKHMQVDFVDFDPADTHIIAVTSDNSNVTVNNLSGNITGSTYNLIPAGNWTGTTGITVRVTDNHVNYDSETFKLTVSDSVSGNIREDTYWDMDTIRITGDIVINDGVTLNIKPGTVVMFYGNYKIDVQGRILAVGNPEDYIVFTTSDTTDYHDNTLTGWGGIRFIHTPETNDTSKLVYCKIQYINCKSQSGCIEVFNYSKIVISNCYIENNIAVKKSLISLSNSHPIIASNFILSNKQISYIIRSYNRLEHIKIINNVICNNYSTFEMFSFEYSKAELINNTICNNHIGYCIIYGSSSTIKVKNTIFWGNYSEGTFRLAEPYKYTSNITFSYCIIPEELMPPSYLYEYGISINNKLSLNPYFTDSESMDYSLSDSSYCINTGTPDTTGLNIPLLDIAGNPRIHPGINTRIDIGAYEFQGTPNKKPILEKTEDQYTLISRPMEMTINYLDDEACCIDINSDNPNVVVANLSGDTTGSKYDLIPTTGWRGSANIAVTIRDACGNTSSDTFKLYVSKCLCYDITKNESWDLDTIKILCDIKVENGATLNIVPGTIVEFQGFYKLDIQGRLLAEGTSSDYITFTTFDTTGCYNFSHKSWGGIMFYDTPDENDTSKLAYCNIGYANSYPGYNGGAVGVKNFSKLVITNCLIKYNYAPYGGAIAVYNSQPVIQNNHILLNKGVYGAGIYLNCYAEIQNNVICNNNGTGLLIEGASPKIVNNTFCYNKVGLDCNYHYGKSSNPIIKNCIFRGNTLNQISLYQDYHHPVIEYCNIQGGREGITFNHSINVYENNIDLDPYFIDEGSMDYCLSDISACINMGTPDTTGLHLPPVDIAGNPRIYDGVIDRVDIGAYEFQGDLVNRPPVINEVEDTLMYCTDTLQMKVEYYDPDINDTNTISVSADNPHISIINLSGDTSGSTYEIIPDLNWKGSTNIYVEVIDSRGAKDVDTFSVEVKNPFCGRLTGNVTWELDTVKVNCDIVVDSAATLTIMPGTVVEFRGPFKLDVRGRLLAEGTPSDHIKFTTCDSLGYNSKSYTGWAGIVFCFTNPDSDTSKLIYCNIEYANNMLYYPSFYSGVVAIKNFSKVVISNCMIRHNYVKYSGALVVYNSQSVIKNNYIINNNCNWSGDGICLGGNVKIKNNVISNYNGWGISILAGSPEIVNNTICYNGGGIYCRSESVPSIKNSIIWGNSNYQMYMNEENMNTEIEYCNIQGGLDNIPNNSTISVYENNIDMEPCFANPLLLDYRLTNNSSCINRGTPDTTGLNLPPVDLSGNPRIFDGNIDIIDIGAYEFQGEPYRPPIVTKTEDTQNLANTIFKSQVRYYDPDINDTHTTSITSDTSAVRIFKVAEEPGRIEYEVIPGNNWIGVANIYIQVTDNLGAMDEDTFRLAFTKHTCGTIKENTIWYLDTVKIDCDIIIDSSATLTIMPSTVVEFQGEYMIDVQGVLLAEGAQNEPIKFTVANTSGLYNDEIVRWKNINFTHVADTNMASQLKYCILEYNMYNAVNVSQFNNLTVSDCIIRYGINSGIYISESNITVQNCNIYNNHNGIDINISGGYLLNNIISNNSYTGIYLTGSSPEIINNTVCKNSDGLFCGFGSNPVIKNSIFWNNSYDPIFIYKTNNRPEITYCNVQGGQENITFGYTIEIYENNIDFEPYFTDIDNMNYSLTDSSSCINRGTPDTTGLNLPTSDITGNPRIIGDTIDIGAYEFPLNFAPSDILLSNNHIDENVRYGSLVGIFSSVDANAEDIHTYSFDVGDGINDADNLSFFISHDSLKIAVCPDHEERDAFRIFVKTTDNGYDNLSCSKVFIINILDINEPPGIYLQSFSVDENSPAGTIVDTLEAMDPDEGQALSYSIISGNTDDAFAIDPFMGEITVNNSSAIDYETTPSFGLTISVQDDGPGNLKDESLITVDINNIDEPVSIIDFDSDILRIFPNPVKGSVYLEFSDAYHDELLIELRSINGTVYYQSEIELSNTDRIIELELSDIPEGLYILNVKSKTISLTRKIEIIQVR